MKNSMNGALLPVLVAATLLAAAQGHAQTASSSPPKQPLFSVGKPANADVEGLKLGLKWVSFDIARVDLRVLATAPLVSPELDTMRGLSVRAALQPVMRRFREPSELLLVNGGYSGSRTDRPVGLLINDGRVTSTPDFQLLRGNPKDVCAARRLERPRFSGLVCATGAGQMSVLPLLDQADLGACRQALQSGPILVEKGRSAICPDEVQTPAYRRSVLCIAGPRAHVVLSEDLVHLYDLARWLIRPAAAGGLGCMDVINLSGDSSAGAALVEGGKSTRRGVTWLGGGTFPQASLLVVLPR